VGDAEAARPYQRVADRDRDVTSPKASARNERLAWQAKPVSTRAAMLEGIRTRPIVAGAYTDNRGGVCPMLAAHRCGGRTSLLSFARSWDAFARAKRVRRGTRRELRVLDDLLVASLASDVDLGAAIAEHRAAAGASLGEPLESGFPGVVTAARLGAPQSAASPGRWKTISGTTQ
jgi:hypothetical protein